MSEAQQQNTRARVRVLVVDDSFFMRRYITNLLKHDPDIEVVGSTSDGARSVEEVKRLRPDVVTMDYQMPTLNGAQATKEILSLDGHLPAVLMISAFTREEAKETFECLEAGAVDFLEKPSGEISLDIEKIESDIVEHIKALGREEVRRNVSLFAQQQRIEQKRKETERGYATRSVVIGSSTGGPPVIEGILSALPADLDAAVFVLQHMPKKFTELFARRLNRHTALYVKEATNGDVAQTSSVFVMPGNSYMEVGKKKKGGETIAHISVARYVEGPIPHSTIDKTMGSIGRCCGKNAIGIILSGMGKDGLEGMREIKKAGGYLIVQDPETAVVGSMPRSVVDEGIADEILSPQDISARIVELVSGNTKS